MVAQGGHVVARQVHQLHGGGALGDADHRVALAEVARVHQQDESALGLILGLQRRHLGVPGDAAVDVVGVEDDDLLGLRGGLAGLGVSGLLGVGRLLRLGGSALRRLGALGRHRRVRLAFSLVVRRESGDHQAEHHDQRQQQRQQLALCFHLLTFPFCFGPACAVS